MPHSNEIEQDVQGNYPAREPFHAQRFTRLLFKSCVLQEIKPAAALLAIHVAHTEDACRYSKAVTFWDSQLHGPLATSQKVLRTARNQAVDAQLLHYQKATTRSEGQYWSTFSESMASINDAPIERSGQSADASEQSDAHRITREVFKSELCESAGHVAALLILAVAHFADSPLSRDKVTFWDSQLMETLGLKSKDKLQAAVDAAVASGWLHVEPVKGHPKAFYGVRSPFAENKEVANPGTNEGTNPDSKRAPIRAPMRTLNGHQSGHLTGTPPNPCPNHGPSTKNKPHGNHGGLKVFREQHWRDLTNDQVEALAATPDEGALRELYRVGVDQWKWPDDDAFFFKFVAMVRHCGTSHAIDSPAASLKANMRGRAFHLLTDSDEDWARRTIARWNRSRREPADMPKVAQQLAAKSAARSDTPATAQQQIAALHSMDVNSKRSMAAVRAGPREGAG